MESMVVAPSPFDDFGLSPTILAIFIAGYDICSDTIRNLNYPKLNFHSKREQHICTRESLSKTKQETARYLETKVKINLEPKIN